MDKTTNNVLKIYLEKITNNSLKLYLNNTIQNACAMNIYYNDIITFFQIRNRSFQRIFVNKMIYKIVSNSTLVNACVLNTIPYRYLEYKNKYINKFK